MGRSEDARRERPLWYGFDHKPIEAKYPDRSFWANPRRFVGNTFVEGVRISTVFLGLDQSLGWSDDPLLYETAVFDLDGSSEIIWRYSSREGALAGHDQIAAAVREWVATDRRQALEDFLDRP